MTAQPIDPPLSESGEEYYYKRDDFMRYIEYKINPTRVACGLPPLDVITAGVCFRILNDFALRNKQLEYSHHNAT